VTVPGHLSIGPLLNEILDTQAAPPAERASWTGSRYSTAKLGGRSLQLFDDCSLANLATSLAQALTRRTFDASHAVPTWKVGDWALVHPSTLNRLEPFFDGLFEISHVSPDGFFVKGRN
jgi:hypothetical protein